MLAAPNESRHLRSESHSTSLGFGIFKFGSAGWLVGASPRPLKNPGVSNYKLSVPPVGPACSPIIRRNTLACFSAMRGGVYPH